MSWPGRLRVAALGAALLAWGCSRSAASEGGEGLASGVAVSTAAASSAANEPPSDRPAPSASSDAPASSASSASTDAPASSASSASSEPAAAGSDMAPPGPAARSTLASLERAPELRPVLTRLREHFGPTAHGPFLLQRAELAAGRVAALVSRADESDPIVVVLDRDQLLFAKEHPTAGISPPVLHATLAPGPERGVAVFAYVKSLHIVAARMWADDSNPYADLEVFHPDACDALSAAYQAPMGWIVACASKTGTVAQRLREDLTRGWPSAGLQVGTAGPVARADVAFDGPAVWTLTQRARAVGGDRTLTFRYGADGQAQ